jgi:hypothetical protein
MLDHRLFEFLSNLISPGGRLMVEYGVTEETHASTARALQLGIPPAVTPLVSSLEEWLSSFQGLVFSGGMAGR